MKLEVIEYLPEKNIKTTPLLFVHGAYHAAWCWEEHFLPYFTVKGFSVYAPSLRGHGKSEGYDKLHSFSLSDYMNDVLEVIQFLKTKPVLIGHSMGGAVVQKIMHLHPDKIRAVVLIASVPPEGVLKEFIQIMFNYCKKVICRSLFRKENYVNNYMNFIADLFFSRELPIRERNNFIRFLCPESIKVFIELARRIVPRSIVAKVPILVLGSRRDCIFSEKTTINIGKIYKTKPAIFFNICHDMMLDPDWQYVADQILDFLNEFAT